MQILKEEVRQRIVEAAMNEFLTNGYEATSMRTIAGKANVTAGNVYAYFRSKEDLLDAILMPVLASLHEMIAMMSKGEQIDTISFDDLATQITDLYLPSKRQFLILMTTSHGTKYATAKQDIIQEIGDRLMLDLMPLMPVHAQDEILALTIASALVEGLLTIFNYTSDEARVRELVLQLMRLMFLPLNTKVNPSVLQ